MSIKGIRAFSPDNDEKITFYKPLTLIVGHNGAGKTVGLCALFPLERVCLTDVFFPCRQSSNA
jgi:AAA15 family ATPase/GTPase